MILQRMKQILAARVRCQCQIQYAQYGDWIGHERKFHIHYTHGKNWLKIATVFESLGSALWESAHIRVTCSSAVVSTSTVSTVSPRCQSKESYYNVRPNNRSTVVMQVFSSMIQPRRSTAVGWQAANSQITASITEIYRSVFTMPVCR